jgi:hypothetical protein
MIQRSSGLTRRTSLSRGTAGLSRSAFRPPAAPVALQAAALAPRPGRDTGFSAAVKLAVRRRAGGGEAGLALCEACGTWLGQYGGDIQHVICRGMGGTSRPGIDSVVNAALMCRRDHGIAEARDPEMYERGFWRHSWETVGACPLMLHGRDGGFTRWLLADGTYGTEAPGEPA